MRLFPIAGIPISPIWASAATTLSSLSVIVNALRRLHYQTSQGPQPCDIRRMEVIS
jgi:cation transport ATPase